MAIEADQVLTALRGRERPALPLKAILRRIGAGKGKSPRASRKELRSLLREMVAAGRLERSDEGYRLARADGLVEGTVAQVQPGEAAQWSARLRADDGAEWRAASLVPLEEGERVLFAPAVGASGRADVVRRLAHERDQWIGIFSKRGGGSVTPYRDSDRWRVRVKGEDCGGAREGEVVVVVPKSAGRAGRVDAGDWRGRIVERLGRPGDAEADFRAVAWRYRLPLEFQPGVIAEAQAFPEALDRSEVARRKDLRDLCFLTIDPSDAKDHDDALCAESADDGRDSIRLWVAIADVAHYVAEHSALDREALVRGNSVYFPGRVIPMLPERISGDLCSLRPDRDRFAMVVELLVGADGQVTSRSFYPAVIRSRARLSYGEAARVMEARKGDAASPSDEDSDAEAGAIPAEVKAQLGCVAACARRLSKRRFGEGSIDFDIRESRVILDAEGRPEAIVESERSVAHRAVEESMLAANREVAKLLERAGEPCVYRIHEAPDPAKLEVLVDLLDTFALLERSRGAQTLAKDAGERDRGDAMPAAGEGAGSNRKPGRHDKHDNHDKAGRARKKHRKAGRGEDDRGRGAKRDRGGAGKRSASRSAQALSPQQLNAALRRAEGHPEQALVNMVALRAMKQARYAPEDLGHFALGFDAYLHFTSPIRRYADLVVHRQLKRLLEEHEPERAAHAAHKPRATPASEAMRGVAIRVSDRERLAVEAEREIVNLKKCAYMARHVDEEFDGRITGVSIHGVFVTLDAVHVDGLVHITQLGEDMVLDERLHQLAGRRSGRRWRLGDPIRVHIDDVDLVRARIRMSLASGPAVEGGERRRGVERGRKKLSRDRRSGPKARRKGAPNRRRGRR